MPQEVYPYLEQLLGAYFHQDAFDSGETVEEIIEDFKATSWDYQRLGARADIQRVIHQHPDDLLITIQSLFAPQVVMGDNDAEVRDWLTKLLAMLG